MPRDMAPEEVRGDGAEKQKRKPVRRDAEKRRQQNLQAQRRYREKLRGRLESLEAMAAATAQAQQQSSPSMTSTIQTVSTPSQDAPELSMVTSSTATSSECESRLSPFDMVTSQMTMSDASFLWDPSVWDYTASSFSNQGVSPAPLNVFDLETENSPSALEIAFAPVQQKQKQSDIPKECRASATVECACDRPHLRITTSHDLAPDGRVEVRLLNIGPSMHDASVTSDPYVNHIRLDSICTLAAMDTLRMQIGITEDMMCSEDFPSPFYRPIRPSAQNSEANRNIVHTVQKMFKTLHPDLRPSTEQITVEHPPFIDALPFQLLRRNLILRKDDVDAEEFLRDLVTGLVCWGGAGLGKKDRDASTGRAPNGTPWDSRSWEAKLWFLRKYWSILGGEHGELVRQSEWWRGIRGEEVSFDMEALA